MGQQMIDESQVDLRNIKNTLQNKADLVNGKVPAEQLPPASQGGADITLSNVKSIDSSSAVAVELGKKADKTYVDGKLAAKADLVDGKVPVVQLPDMPSGGADKTLSNVTDIAPNSKVQVELDKKVDKTYVDGRLSDKADLVDGKVPADQLPDIPSGGADITLSNVKSIDPSSAVAVELGKKADETYVDGELATKADLVGGKVPVSQLPDMPTDGADKTLSNVTDIAPTSKVQVELDKKVNKSGDMMTGDLIIKKSQPMLRGAANIDLSNFDGMCLAIEGKDANNKGFARIDLYRRGSVQQSEAHLIALNINGQRAELGVFINDEGAITSRAPTPLLTSNNTEIATTAFVKGLIKDYVTESWKDDNGNWYEVYASGKVRQGGIFDNGSSVKTASVTINFLKPFANTNYTVVGNPSRGTVVNTSTSMALGIHSKTPSNFAFTFLGYGNADTVQYVEWVAEGQGA